MAIEGPGYVLGISAYFHDSAAALVKDGEVIAAIQEERLSRKKQDSGLPVKAAQFCLEAAGISIQDVSTIAYYEKPFQKFERLLETQIAFYPQAYLPFRKTVKSWLREKLWVPHNIRKELGFKGDFFYAEHHESHAAAACYASPFEEAAYLTLDGVGEWACASMGSFENNELTQIALQSYPHSVGMLYSAFTQYCGFRVNSGEYKLMGLAPYGTPQYVDLIKDNFVTINTDGSIALNLKYFQFHRGMRMINARFESVMGKPALKPEKNISTFYMDVAASIQLVLEEIVLKTAQHVRTVTGKKYLCYGGGVALNCKANQRLLESGIFEDIFIYSASGDAGGAVGTALLCANQEAERKIIPISSYLGKTFSETEIEATLEEHKVHFSTLAEENIYDATATLLKEGKVIAWYQGKDEMGPRALGNRSILARPNDAEMRDRINEMIKFREQFRPFAPVVLEEFADHYFDNVRNANEMLFTFNSNNASIPACVHRDGSARVQTVNARQNERLYQLLVAFHEKSGIQVLINTSFNRRGEPMVHSPKDALRTFFGSGLDVLVMGNVMVQKQGNENVKIKDVRLELD
ncbi:MAG: carbamoyltransferase [Crocinitomicaceae bacterium]